ncbi:hypothetical protein JTB14_024799 [Gonioctena quinquepunctata]|nr:hypothetical protein JTB14_024799 [Gonioctena quinquepunctata]
MWEGRTPHPPQAIIPYCTRDSTRARQSKLPFCSFGDRRERVSPGRYSAEEGRAIMRIEEDVLVGQEVRKLQNRFDEVSSGDEYADDSDSEREDRMIVSDHFSETEEEEDIEEINEHNDNEGGDDGDTSARTRGITHDQKIKKRIHLYYVGKNRFKWCKMGQPKNVGTRSHNLVRKLPGVVGEAKTAKTVLHSWELFISHNVNCGLLLERSNIDEKVVKFIRIPQIVWNSRSSSVKKGTLRRRMATSGMADFLTCRQVLNMMVILGCMFNYMLRVNLTIAIVDMIAHSNSTNATLNVTNATSNVTIATSNMTKSAHLEQIRFDWTVSQKNDILGSFFWGYILTELPGGRMAEIVGARRIFGGGMLAASLLTILTPAACYLNIYVIIILRALMGFFLGATMPAIPPIATKWIPPMERSKFMANMVATSLGAAFTLPVCGFLISSAGWASVFYFTGAIGVIWSILWFILIADSPAQHPRITLEERTEIETKIAEGAEGKGVKPDKVPWGKILTNLPVYAIIITHVCSIFGFFTVVNQLPTYMKDVLHFNIKDNGLLSSLPYLGKYIMAILSSYFADLLRRSGKLSTTATRKIFNTFGLVIPGFLMGIQAIWEINAALSVTVFTGALFFNGAVTAGYLSNALDIAPHFSGTIFGLANTLSSLGGWVSTEIVAIVTEDSNTFDSWKYIFWMLVGTYVFGAVFYLVFGTGNMQTFNSVQNIDGNELKPLKTDAETEKEEDIMA